MYGGMWIEKMQESIQDVLVTDSRLAEEPDCILIKDIPLSTKQYLEREYECVVASLFFETLNEPREYICASMPRQI